jgi:hypothetical protein
MPNPHHPDVPQDPGDGGILRPIAVRTVTLHRTIGTWPGDFSVGKHRNHNQGTFQFLIGQAPGQWVQFYAVNTFCSHAAGSNEVGPGIEISGQNGGLLHGWLTFHVWGLAPREDGNHAEEVSTGVQAGRGACRASR